MKGEKCECKKCKKLKPVRKKKIKISKKNDTIQKYQKPEKLNTMFY